MRMVIEDHPPVGSDPFLNRPGPLGGALFVDGDIRRRPVDQVPSAGHDDAQGQHHGRPAKTGGHRRETGAQRGRQQGDSGQRHRHETALAPQARRRFQALEVDEKQRRQAERRQQDALAHRPGQQKQAQAARQDQAGHAPADARPNGEPSVFQGTVQTMRNP